MNLQLLRHGIGRSTLTRVAGLAFIFSILASAQAQVATHTQLSSAATDHGLTFTANVSDSVGNPATDGIVTLKNTQGLSLGSAFVKDGQATLTLDQQPSGQVFALYSGSDDFRPSTAQAQVTGDATSTLPDFTVTASPTSLSLNPGQYGTIVLTITPLNGFNEMVTLSCSGNPAQSACTFSPATLTPLNGAVVTSSLQITTQASSGAMLAWPGHSSHTAYAIVLPGLLALAGLGALRKRSGLNALSVLGLAALLVAGTLGLSACAQRYDYLHHPPAFNPGIAAGNYTITVAAYSNNGASVTSHTLNIALTVK
jgi:hypothetical protein